jgi:hypothetical protein
MWELFWAAVLFFGYFMYAVVLVCLYAIYLVGVLLYFVGLGIVALVRRRKMKRIEVLRPSFNLGPSRSPSDGKASPADRLNAYIATLSPAEREKAERQEGIYALGPDENAPHRALVDHARATGNAELEDIMRELWEKAFAENLCREGFSAEQAWELASANWPVIYARAPEVVSNTAGSQRP